LDIPIYTCLRWSANLSNHGAYGVSVMRLCKEADSECFFFNRQIDYDEDSAFIHELHRIQMEDLHVLVEHFISLARVFLH